MRNKIILFCIGFIVWCLLNWPVDLVNIILGIIVSLFITLVTSDLFIEESRVLPHYKKYLWFLYYIPIFIWECIKANLDVAYRVIHPRLKINPGIVKVKTTLKTDTALTFLANTITLTPGTMSVDVDKKNGFLYIHWINVTSQDIEKATEIIVLKFEKILRRIFE